MHMPVVVQRQMPMVQTSENCVSPDPVVQVPAGEVHRQDPHHMGAMAVEMGFWAFFFHIFRAPPGRLELSASFRALDGEEFFAIEGSVVN